MLLSGSGFFAFTTYVHLGRRISRVFFSSLFPVCTRLVPNLRRAFNRSILMFGLPRRVPWRRQPERRSAGRPGTIGVRDPFPSRALRSGRARGRAPGAKAKVPLGDFPCTPRQHRGCRRSQPLADSRSGVFISSVRPRGDCWRMRQAFRSADRCAES
jgi:hypothetical protein